MFSSVILIAATATLVAGAALEHRASKPCTQKSADYGYFGAVTNHTERFGLDAKHYVTLESGATSSNKEFFAYYQVCPDLGAASVSIDQLEDPALGRIVLKAEHGIAKYTCLTVANPDDAASGKPLYVKAQPCRGGHSPIASQTFVHGYLDDYTAMFWSPDHKTTYALSKDNKNLLAVTGSDKRIQLMNTKTKVPHRHTVDLEFYTDDD